MASPGVEGRQQHWSRLPNDALLYLVYQDASAAAASGSGRDFGGSPEAALDVMLRSLVVLARGLIPLKQFVDTIVAPMLAGLAGAEPPKPPERGDEPMDPRVRAYCIWLFGLRYALQSLPPNANTVPVQALPLATQAKLVKSLVRRGVFKALVQLLLWDDEELAGHSVNLMMRLLHTAAAQPPAPGQQPVPPPVDTAMCREVLEDGESATALFQYVVDLAEEPIGSPWCGLAMAIVAHIIIPLGSSHPRIPPEGLQIRAHPADPVCSDPWVRYDYDSAGLEVSYESVDQANLAILRFFHGKLDSDGSDGPLRLPPGFGAKRRNRMSPILLSVIGAVMLALIIGVLAGY